MTDKFEIVIDLDGRRYVEEDVYKDEGSCRDSAQQLKDEFSNNARVYVRKNDIIIDEIAEESALRWLRENYAS